MPAAAVTDVLECDSKGSEVSLYYDTADFADGTCATPVWVFHKGIVGDLDIGDTEDLQEQSQRDPAQIFKQYGESKPDLEISGEQAFASSYEGFRYVNSIRSGSIARNFLALSGYITEVGSIGFRGKFRNGDRTIKGPESGAKRGAFMLKPAACVRNGCRIIPVEVLVANAIVTYDPTIFVGAASMGMLGEAPVEIQDTPLFRGLKATSAEEVFTDVTPIIGWLGVEETDKLINALVETSAIQPTLPERSARRVRKNAQGIAAFNRNALLSALMSLLPKDYKDSELS